MKKYRRLYDKVTAFKKGRWLQATWHHKANIKDILGKYSSRC